MDVIGAHARRLPALDERWEARPYPREELTRALVAGGVAGPAGHPHDNVFGNIRMLVDHDPDKLFGFSDMPEPFGFEDIVRIVGEAAGVPIDALATEGSPGRRPIASGSAQRDLSRWSIQRASGIIPRPSRCWNGSSRNI